MAVSGGRGWYSVGAHSLIYRHSISPQLDMDVFHFISDITGICNPGRLWQKDESSSLHCPVVSEFTGSLNHKGLHLTLGWWVNYICPLTPGVAWPERSIRSAWRQVCNFWLCRFSDKSLQSKPHDSNCKQEIELKIAVQKFAMPSADSFFIGYLCFLHMFWCCSWLSVPMSCEMSMLYPAQFAGISGPKARKKKLNNNRALLEKQKNQRKIQSNNGFMSLWSNSQKYGQESWILSSLECEVINMWIVTHPPHWWLGTGIVMTHSIQGSKHFW